MAQVTFRPGIPGALPAAWIIQPKCAEIATPILAVHGLNRETELMANLLARRSDATARTIILPIFDHTSWPRYQRAACKNRSDWALLALLKVLRDEGWIGAELPDISGFSGGAQFAHRFAWLYPDHVARLCLVAPGWWTFPDARGAYPLGIHVDGSTDSAPAFRLKANLRRFLDREIVVTVGELDTAQDKNLRQHPDIMAQQGANRLERARNWTAGAIRAARQLGIHPRIDFALMKDCGHSFADCVANGGLAQVFVPKTLNSDDARAVGCHDQLEEVA